MNITETAIGAEMLDDIRDCASAAAGLIDVDLNNASPSEIINSIDAFVFEWQKGNRPEVDEDDDLSLMFGSLWGEQLVRDLGWQWVEITFHDHDDSKAVGVVSPNRSLAIYPLHFVYGCMENDAPVTIMLAYNMLKDGSKIPSLPSKGYENVMDNVHHIVPRE